MRNISYLIIYSEIKNLYEKGFYRRASVHGNVSERQHE